MRCGKVQKLLSDYIDECLSPPLQREVERHCAGCSCCADYLEGLGKTVDILKTVSSAAPAGENLPFFWNRLRRKLLEHESPGRAPAWWSGLYPAHALAAAIIAVSAGFVAFYYGGGREADMTARPEGRMELADAADYVSRYGGNDGYVLRRVNHPDMSRPFMDSY